MSTPRVSRAERRVLLVLLTGAPGLSASRVSRAAMTSPRKARAVLGRLEHYGHADAEWEHRTDGARVYELTAQGRRAALAAAGLEGMR